MIRLRSILRPAALALLSAVAAPSLAHACAVCAAMNEKNRLAFFDMTIFMSLLPLGLIAWGVVWLAWRGRHVLADEFREREDAVVPPAEAIASPTPATAETPGWVSAPVAPARRG